MFVLFLENERIVEGSGLVLKFVVQGCYGKIHFLVTGCLNENIRGKSWNVFLCGIVKYFKEKELKYT
nr:hypothetical protein [Zobellia laminariae]